MVLQVPTTNQFHSLQQYQQFSFLLQTSDVFVDRACLPITPFHKPNLCWFKAAQTAPSQSSAWSCRNEWGRCYILIDKFCESYESGFSKGLLIYTHLQKKELHYHCEAAFKGDVSFKHLSKKRGGGMRGYVATPWKNPVPNRVDIISTFNIFEGQALRIKSSSRYGWSCNDPTGRKPRGICNQVPLDCAPLSLINFIIRPMNFAQNSLLYICIHIFF